LIIDIEIRTAKSAASMAARSYEHCEKSMALVSPMGALVDDALVKRLLEFNRPSRIKRNLDEDDVFAVMITWIALGEIQVFRRMFGDDLEFVFFQTAGCLGRSAYARAVVACFRIRATKHSGKPIGSIMTALRDELHIVVTECGNGIWEWEICRQGEPLAARMRDGPFKSQEVALAAGKVALREFLELLEFGHENDA
jgi:hypothetical protein